MAGYGGQSSKRKLFSVFEILCKYSDDEHPLKANDILNLLEKDYEITAERKSVYDDIKVLRACGFDIERTSSTQGGFYLSSRAFEVAEVRLLIDAILSAKFITPAKTKILIEKMYEQLSIYQAKEIKNQAYYDNRLKFDNEQIYYAVDAINRAIAEKRKISFVYHRKKIEDGKIVNDKGKTHIISPYALCWAQDKYYVVGNYDKYNDTTKYRLDRMEYVEILDETARPFSEVSQYETYFDIADYLNKNVMMYDGEEDTVELICEMKLLGKMIDRFGDHVNFTSLGEDKFRVRASVFISEGLENWLIPYCDSCYIAKPEYLRESVIKKAKKIAEYLEVNTSKDKR